MCVTRYNCLIGNELYEPSQAQSRQSRARVLLGFGIAEPNLARRQLGKVRAKQIPSSALLCSLPSLTRTSFERFLEYNIRHVNPNTTKFHHRPENINHTVTQPQINHVIKIHYTLIKYIHIIALLRLILCPTPFCFKDSLNTPRHRLNKGVHQRTTLIIPYL